MTMLAEAVDAVIGIDTHRDSHRVEIADRAGKPVAALRIGNDSAGFAQLLAAIAQVAPGPRVAVCIEGTEGYGIGLARALTAAGLLVIECVQPSRQQRRGTGKSGPVDAHLTDHRRGLAAPGMSPAGPRQRRTLGLIMVPRFGLASVQPTHGDQAEPEVADLGQQPVQRGLVSEQAPDDRLLALAADLEAIEPGGPPAIQDTRHADLIPGRPAGGAHSTSSQRPGGAAERTMPCVADCARRKDPRLPRRSRAGLRAAIPVLPAGCFSFICGR